MRFMSKKEEKRRNTFVLWSVPGNSAADLKVYIHITIPTESPRVAEKFPQMTQFKKKECMITSENQGQSKACGADFITVDSHAKTLPVCYIRHCRNYTSVSGCRFPSDQRPETCFPSTQEGGR